MMSGTDIFHSILAVLECLAEGSGQVRLFGPTDGSMPSTIDPQLPSALAVNV